MSRSTLVRVALIALLLACGSAAAEAVYVGNEGRIVVVSPVEPVAEDGRDDITIRSITGDPSAGWTVRFVADVPGTFDLKDHLRRPDDQPLASAVVDVRSVSESASLSLVGVSRPTPRISQAWRTTLIAAAVLWAIGVVVLVGSKLLVALRWRRPVAPAVREAPPSNAAQLSGLLEQLRAGRLSGEQAHQLERLARRCQRRPFGRKASGPLAVLDRWRYGRTSEDPSRVEAALRELLATTGGER